MTHPLALLASLYLNALVLAALALFVFRSKPESTSHRWFAAHTVLLTIWTIAIARVHAESSLEFWGRLTFAATSLVPPTFLAFSRDRKSTRLNSSHSQISYAVFCLKKKKSSVDEHV